MAPKNKDSKVIRDWTKETLVIDLENSLGEKYHFEIEPNADPNSVPSRGSDAPTLGTHKGNRKTTLVWLHFPIPVQLDMFKP